MGSHFVGKLEGWLLQNVRKQKRSVLLLRGGFVSWLRLEEYFFCCLFDLHYTNKRVFLPIKWQHNTRGLYKVRWYAMWKIGNEGPQQPWWISRTRSHTSCRTLTSPLPRPHPRPRLHLLSHAHICQSVPIDGHSTAVNPRPQQLFIHAHRCHAKFSILSPTPGFPRPY